MQPYYCGRENMVEKFSIERIHDYLFPSNYLLLHFPIPTLHAPYLTRNFPVSICSDVSILIHKLILTLNNKQ